MLFNKLIKVTVDDIKTFIENFLSIVQIKEIFRYKQNTEKKVV